MGANQALCIRFNKDDNMCRLAPCVKNVHGEFSEKGTLYNLWHVSFDNPIRFDSYRLGKIAMKISVSPESLSPLFNDGHRDERFGFLYETRVYKSILEPLNDGLCNNFLPCLNYSVNCTTDDLINVAAKGSRDSQAVKNAFNRNIYYMLFKWNNVPPIDQPGWAKWAIYNNSYNEVVTNTQWANVTKAYKTKNNTYKRFEDKDKPTKDPVVEVNVAQLKLIPKFKNVGHLPSLRFITLIFEDVFNSTLEAFFKVGAKEDIFGVVLQVAAACFALGVTKTMHNNLNEKTIIVIRINPRIFTYRFDNQDCIFTCTYLVRISSFEKAFSISLGPNGKNQKFIPNMDFDQAIQCFEAQAIKCKKESFYDEIKKKISTDDNRIIQFLHSKLLDSNFHPMPNDNPDTINSIEFDDRGVRKSNDQLVFEKLGLDPQILEDAEQALVHYKNLVREVYSLEQTKALLKRRRPRHVGTEIINNLKIEQARHKMLVAATERATSTLKQVK